VKANADPSQKLEQKIELHLSTLLPKTKNKSVIYGYDTTKEYIIPVVALPNGAEVLQQ
jgi:hypothetical protein